MIPQITIFYIYDCFGFWEAFTYTSQDKGTIENRIGLIRLFFPKGTDLRNIDHQRIQTVQRYINNRPLRKFDYLSPIHQAS